MKKEEQVKISKFLCLVLRHRPGLIGVSLDRNGWADTAGLLEKMRRKGHELSMEELKEVVLHNDKKRFAFSADGARIRASQGHTIEVDLELEEKTPPAVLYHGTSEKYLASILEEGIGKGERHHVHLSTDTVTALQVGSRHGNPVVLSIRSLEMYESGFRFYISENHIWLTDHVAPEFIDQQDL